MGREPNPDYVDATDCSMYGCVDRSCYPIQGLGCKLYPITPLLPPKPDLIQPATPDEIKRYAGRRTPVSKPIEHPHRLKFKRVYKAPGYPIDPRADRARALDGHALTAPRTYDHAAGRLRLIGELN